MSTHIAEAACGDLLISVGPDGRVFFHDLDRDLIEVALALNPGDELMRRRRALCAEARAEVGERQAADVTEKV